MVFIECVRSEGQIHTLQGVRPGGAWKRLVGRSGGGKLVAYIQLWRIGFFKRQWDFRNCTVIASIPAYTGKT